MLEQITVTSSISAHSFGLLGICFFSAVLIYILITGHLSKRETKKVKKAKMLIYEGHERAQNGRKNDGYFEEIKKVRNPEPENVEAVEETNVSEDAENENT